MKFKPNFKFTFSLLIFLLMLLLGCSKSYFVVQAAPETSNAIVVSVDWDEIDFDVSPIIIEGRTMVPLRAIFEALDAQVEWDGITRTVKGFRQNINVSLLVDSKTAIVNGEEIQLDVPATIVAGRTLVPARFISESLGAKVTWDAKLRKVEVLTQDVIHITDSNFEKVIRKSIKKYSGDLFSSDLKSIKVLEGRESGISNIEGIQYMKNIKYLYLEKNNISDISLLSSLNELEMLSISENRIADLSPLSTLTNLKIIYMHTNLLRDLTPLSPLTNLEELYLGGNYIKDIEPLSTLINLKSLFLGDNQIIDLHPIEKLINVINLDIYANSVLDITPLKSLNKLEELYIEYYDEKSLLNDILYEKYEDMLQKAKEIVKRVIKPEMTDLEKELALHDYIVLNTVYDYENYLLDKVPEESHQPYGVLVNKVAVCDGFARTIQILLNMVGIESEFVHGDSDSEKGWYGHAWNIVKIDGEYFHLDVTFNNIDKDDRKIKNDSITHTYFNISDRQISFDHRWEKSAYTSCNSDSEYFTRISELKGDRIIDGDNAYFIDRENKIIKMNIADSTTVSLSDKKAEMIAMYNGFIYYIHNLNGDANAIYKLKTDGTEETKVYDGWAKYLKSDGENVYFINEDDRISRLTQSGAERITSGTVVSALYFSQDYIIYKAYKWNSGAKLYKINKVTEEDNRIGFDSPSGFSYSTASGYLTYYYTPLERVVDDWIYYVNEDEENSLFKIKVDGTGRTRLNNSDSTIIDIYGDWLYYHNNSDNSRVYKVRIDGTEDSKFLD